ncbi:MAG: hypothetical protein QMD04_04340, partial [Anaerolineales bacterium]|nr:hypothetical protein [Anaerolineales bacterium]
MKNKITYFIVTISLLMLLAGGIKYQQVSAQKIPLDDSIGVIQQEPTEGSKESDSPPSEQFPNSVFVSSEQKTKNDEVIDALKEIKDKADQTHLIKHTYCQDGCVLHTKSNLFLHYQP